MKQAMKQTEYARHRGVSAAAVSRAIKEGRITLQNDGRIDPVAADAQWEANTRKRADPRSQPRARQGVHTGADRQAPADRAFLDARTRRELADANLAELRYAQACGELVRADDVRAEWASKISALRDALLNLGARLAPVVAAEADMQRCQMLIDDAVHETMDAFRTSVQRGAGETKSN